MDVKMATYLGFVGALCYQARPRWGANYYTLFEGAPRCTSKNKYT